MARRNRLDDVLGREIATQELRTRLDRQREQEEATRFKFDLTPRQLYNELAKFVIGQEEAIQRVSNAVCYHYQNLSRGREAKKSNVLLIGPTGCGKTYVVEKVSQILRVPLLISDATKYSAAGYVGDKVENLVQDLVIKADGDLNAASRGIIYIDEIDKIAAKDMLGRDVSGRDVQNGLLKIVESGDIKVMTREGERVLSTKNILFIGGGAFSDLYRMLRGNSQLGFVNPSRQKDVDDGEALYRAEPHELVKALQQYGMIPELLGRIPVIARFRQLSQEDLVRILKESEESPTKDYQRDFEAYGITAQFAPDAYETIAKLAYERGMGARGLISVIEESLTPFKFNLPGLGIQEIMLSSEAILNPDATLLALLETQKNKPQGGNENG